MKNKKLRLLSFGLVATFGLLLPSITAHAAPDYEVHNTTETIGGTWASANSDVLIGPNAQITVSGDWYVTANNFYIHPTATITGTGTLHIMNPSTYNGKPAATTMMDGGSVMIGCKVSIENGSTVTLTAIDPATTYAASGFTETAPQLALTALGIGSNLNFNNIGAHIIMGNNNVVLASAATITRTDLNTVGFPADPTPGTAAQAYLVTSGTGVVTKQGLANGASFDYPIGQSTASDYTPATITNAAGTRNVNVQVKTYAGSGATEANTTYGVDRTWQVSSDVAGTASVALTHNAATEGSNFNATHKAFVTQQTATGVWSLGTAVAPTTPNYTHTASFTVPLTAGATSYFSKSNDEAHSLNPTATLASKLFLEAAMTNATTMRNILQNSSQLPTTSPFGSAPATYSSINNPAGPAGAVTDWILVKVVNAATPSTILEQRSLLLKTNGTIVDVEGKVPTFFDRTGTSVRVIVQPRHHMRIATNNFVAATNDFTGTQTYDFTTGQNKAYKGLLNDQMIQNFGVYALFAGDNFSDGAIDGSDFNNVDNEVVNGTFGYVLEDLNMDGVVDGTDFNYVDKNVVLGPFYNVN